VPTILTGEISWWARGEERAFAHPAFARFFAQGKQVSENSCRRSSDGIASPGTIGHNWIGFSLLKRPCHLASSIAGLSAADGARSAHWISEILRGQRQARLKQLVRGIVA
jgi:hypothetical protein